MMVFRALLFFAVVGMASAKRCDISNLEDCPLDQPAMARFQVGAFGRRCPTCLPPRKSCSKTERKACDKPEVCSGNETATLDGCCLTCKPERPKCTKALRKACKESYATLEECSEDMAGKNYFDFEKCCPICRRNKGKGSKGKGPKNPKKAKCTKEERKEAKKDTRLCELGEKPQKLEDGCAMSCKRPRAQKSLHKLTFKLCKDVQKCEEDETSEAVEDSFCRTCRRNRRKKCPGCSKNQMCVFKDDEGVQLTNTTCRNKKSFRWRLKSTVRNAFKNLTAEVTEASARDLVFELIERFCDEPDNAEKCEKWEAYLLENLDVSTEKIADTDKIRVTVDLAEPIKTGRRLLSSDGPDVVLNAAMSGETGDELAIEVDTDETTVEPDAQGKPSEEPLSTPSAAFTIKPFSVLLSIAVAVLVTN